MTVRAKLPDVIPLWDAVMLLDPIAAAVARPAPLTLTDVGFDDVQVAVLVRF